ncbi:MAG: hypothetical protein HRF44_00200 [Ignavibacterium sp.]
MHTVVTLFAVLLFSPSLLHSQTSYVGSKNSDKYHVTSCQWAKRISPANLVTFDSPEAASKAGYVACKVCRPPTSSNSTSSPTQKIDQAKKGSNQTSTQCAAITKKGTRCKRKAQAGSTYCWQHEK